MNNMIFGRLDVVAWSMSAGGEHFSGTIYHDCMSYQLTYEINKWQTREFNKKDTDFVWKVGHTTNRYFSLDDLVEDAKKYCIENKIGLLVSNIYQPSIVYYCYDENIGKQLTHLGNEMEQLYEETDDPWAMFPEKTAKLELEWDNLLGKLNEIEIST